MGYDALRLLDSKGFKFLRIQKNSKYEYSDKPENKNTPSYQPAYARANGFADAETVIREGWIQKHNLAGKVPAGMIVIDVDVKNGGDITYLEETLGSLPRGYWQDTTSNGFHYFCEVPFEVKGKFDLIKGVEILGEGALVMLCQSSIKGDDGAPRYYVPHLEEGQSLRINKQWSELIVGIVEQKTKVKVAYAKQALEVEKAIELCGPATNKQKQNYSTAAFASIKRELAEAPNGSRFKALVKASLSAGNFCHILNYDAVIAGLEAVVADWPEFNKNRGVIKWGVSEGMNSPREIPNGYNSEYREQMLLAINFHMENANSAVWNKPFELSDGSKVRAASVRDVFTYLVNRAKEVVDIEFSCSRREIVDALKMGFNTVEGALEVLISQLKVIVKISNFKAKNNSNAIEKELPEKALATTWALTANGLDGVKQVNKTQQATTSHQLTTVNRAIALGIFTSNIFSRDAAQLTKALAVGPMTTSQLVEATGFDKRKVQRLLADCAKGKLIIRGDKTNPHKLAEGFRREVLTIAEAQQLKAKRKEREVMRETERDARINLLKDLDKAKKERIAETDAYNAKVAAFAKNWQLDVKGFVEHLKEAEQDN